MRCTRARKFLPLYVAGDLAGRRRSAVARHLQTCAACRSIASDYDASRDLLRAAAVVPEFDGAFYEEIRRSVLAEIKRDRRTPAPPARLGALFNARLAYAASFALLVLAAALAIHGYLNGTREDGATPNTVAQANQRTPVAPVPDANATSEYERAQAQRNNGELARGTERADSARRKPQLSQRRANGDSARVVAAPPPRMTLARRAPVPSRRNPLAPPPPGAQATESLDSSLVQAEKVSRIEIQTADPNIRIIWLAPEAEEAEEAAKPLQ